MQESRYYNAKFHGIEILFFPFLFFSFPFFFPLPPSPSLLSPPFSFTLFPVLFTRPFYSHPLTPTPTLLLSFCLYPFFVLMTKIARETRGAYYLTGRLKK